MSRLIKSFKYAGQGLKHCIRKEKNFQLHCIAGIMAILIGIVLKISDKEWILIVISIALVLAFEMVNTAIEHICNLIQPGFNSLIKIIKDVSAGAVLIIALMAAVCGSIIYIPKILAIFQNI